MLAVAIVESLGLESDGIAPDGVHGFSIERVDEGLLLTRWAHAVGIIRREGSVFKFLRMGYALPTLTTTDVDEMVDHLIDIVAEVIASHPKNS